MTLQEFVSAAKSRKDLTSIRLCSAIIEEGQRPKNPTKGPPMTGAADDIVRDVEAIVEGAPDGTRFELRAAFETAPTESFPL